MPDVKMPDGKILRFPEETSLEVIDKAAKDYISGILPILGGCIILNPLSEPFSEQNYLYIISVLLI